MSSSAHPPDGDLRALLDGELPAALRLEALRHTAECSSCNERVTALEQASDATDELLSMLAPPATALQLSVIIRRARQARVRRAGLIAAAVTILVTAVAGATVGRPFVRALAARVWGVVHPVAPPPGQPELPGGGQTGIAVVPGALAEIAFDTPQEGGVLRVSLADTAELAIRSSAPVTYRVYPGGVVVHNRGSAASYDIVIPQAAPHVRIVVGGRLVLEKVGPRMVGASATDSAGRYVIGVR